MHTNQNNSEEIVMKTKRWMVAILCLSVLVTGMMSLSGCGTNKAYIAVDEKGTKASAAIAVETVYTALEEGVYRATTVRLSMPL